MAPCVVILRVLSSLKMKTEGLTRYSQASLGLSTLLTSHFPPTSKTFFKVSQWPVLLALPTPCYSPIIRARVLSSLHLNFYFTNSRPLGTMSCGTGSGLPLAPKRSKSPFGRLYVTDFPPKHSYLLDSRMWILVALDASPQKRLFTFLGTAHGRKRSSFNLQESCPFPSFVCSYKTGLDKMLRWIGLPCPTSPYGKSISLSLVGNFG